MKRPGQKDERFGGCCLFVFGLPFFCAGAFAAMTALGFTKRGLADKSIGSVIGLTAFGAIFALVGLGVSYMGLRMLRQGRKLSRPLTAPPTAPTAWRDSPWFPKPPKHARGANPMTGRMRLAPESSAVSNMIGLIIFAIFWNGLVAAFAYSSLFGNSHKKSSGVGAMIVLGIFGLVGLLILYGALRQIALVMFVGDTGVEISKEPLTPGTTASAAVMQAGNFPITSLTVSLICREIVTYRQGTDTVTHREEVHREMLHEARGLRAQSGRPAAEFQVRVPADAAPSFASPNNKLEWALEVKMDIPSRPDVLALFPVRVAPEAQASGATNSGSGGFGFRS